VEAANQSSAIIALTPDTNLALNRTRVLCPAGIDPTKQWPKGSAPLLAYVFYSPS
jgi:hypothetical protein